MAMANINQHEILFDIIQSSIIPEINIPFVVDTITSKFLTGYEGFIHMWVCVCVYN